MSIENDDFDFDDVKPIIFPETKKQPVWWIRFKELWLIDKIIDIYYWFLGLYEKTSRMFAYAKFGMHNYDFDHVYLMNIIQFKLERMKKIFESSVHHEHEEIIKEIDFVLGLIKKYQNDDFMTPLLKDHEKQFGKIVDEWKKLPDGNFQWIMKYEKNGVIYEPDTEHAKKADEAKMEIYKLAEKKRKECLHKIMYFMAENMEKWWD